MEPLTTLLYHGTPPADVRIFLAAVGLNVLARLWDSAADVLEGLQERLAGPEPSAIEQLQKDYETGEISLEEFERRAELALDDRAAVVVVALEDVNGVGPKRAAAVADEFGNLEAVHRANVDDLTDAHRVGQATAEQIIEEL